jgi:hypothetical protein
MLVQHQTLLSAHMTAVQRLLLVVDGCRLLASRHLSVATVFASDRIVAIRNSWQIFNKASSCDVVVVSFVNKSRKRGF